MKTLRENGDRGRQLLVSAVGAMAKVDWTADVKELQVYTYSKVLEGALVDYALKISVYRMW